MKKQAAQTMHFRSSQSPKANRSGHGGEFYVRGTRFSALMPCAAKATRVAVWLGAI